MLRFVRAFSARVRARISFVALVIAITIFCGLGLWMAGSLPSWSEEISIFPSSGYRVLGATREGAVDFTPSCTDPAPPRFVISPARPVYSLCISGKTFPVMITSYASGLPYWPSALFSWLHDGDIFVLRKLGLVIGVLEIIATFFLVRRLVDAESAACCALVLACHSAYLHTHVIAMYYEAWPWFALTLGVLGYLIFSDGSTKRKQVLAAGCLGLGLFGAFLANIKALLVIVPLGVLAWRGREKLPPVQRWHGGLALGGLVLAFVPLLIFAMLDPASGISQQFSSRIGFLLSQFGLRTVALEFYSTLIFGTDMGFYGDMVTGRASTPWLPAILCMALGLAYPTHALVQVLRRGEGSWVAALCAAEIWTFLFVSAFLYGQFPSANYSPVNPAFAMCIGLSLGALAKRVHPYMTMGVVLATLCTFSWNVVRRGDYRAHYTTSTNAAAEIEAARFLRDNVKNKGLVLTASYNLAGVFESLGAGIVHPIQVDPFVAHGCTNRDQVDEDCLVKRWRTLLDEPQKLPRPWYVVMPAIDSRVDEPTSRLMEPMLRKAAEEKGISITIEGRFYTWSGIEALRVVRVNRD